MEKNTGLNKMVLTTIDRIDNGVMVLVTHTEPVLEIHLPQELFLGFDEGDVVRLSMEKDEEGKEEIEKDIGEMKKELNRSFLGI